MAHARLPSRLGDALRPVDRDRRHPARGDLSLDPWYDTDHGIVALRSCVRGDVVVGQPGAVLITFE